MFILMNCEKLSENLPNMVRNVRCSYSRASKTKQNQRIFSHIQIMKIENIKLIQKETEMFEI